MRYKILFKQIHFNTKHLFIGSLLLIIISEGIILMNKGRFNVEAELMKYSSNPDTFRSIRNNLPTIIKQGGIDGALTLVNKALKEERIPLFRCHPLIHLIGHQAYEQYKKDFDLMAQHVNNVCYSAYQHGVEGQIVIEGGNVREELKKFCIASKKMDPSSLCYHGAGHAFLQITLNIEKALAFCDTLERVGDIPEADNSNCYAGIFSEYGNRAQNYDGDTGENFPGPPLVGFPFGHPLEFCRFFAPKYQEACDRQLTKLLEDPVDVTKSIQNCLFEGYPEETKARCIEIVGYHYAVNTLSHDDTVIPPSLIFSLPKNLRQRFIIGVKTIFTVTELSGLKKDLRAFCMNFEQEEDKRFCLSSSRY